MLGAGISTNDRRYSPARAAEWLRVEVAHQLLEETRLPAHADYGTLLWLRFGRSDATQLCAAAGRQPTGLPAALRRLSPSRKGIVKMRGILTTCAVRQVVGLLGYTSRDRCLLGRAAHDIRHDRGQRHRRLPGIRLLLGMRVSLSSKFRSVSNHAAHFGRYRSGRCINREWHSGYERSGDDRSSPKDAAAAVVVVTAGAPGCDSGYSVKARACLWLSICAELLFA
jgi:hypothetical protein